MNGDLFLEVKKQKLNTKKKTALNKFRSREHLIRLFLALGLMTFVVLSFISIAEIELIIWPVLCVGAFFTIIIWLEWGRKNSVYAVLFFVFGFILIGFVLKNNYALNGVMLLYNTLAQKIGALGLRNPQMYVIDAAESAYPVYFTYIMCLFAAFVGLVSYMVVAHKQYLYLIIYSALLAACSIMGFEIYPLYVIAFVIFVLLILFYNNSCRLRLSYLYMAAMICLAAFISISVSYMFEPVLKLSRSPYEYITDKINYSEGSADSYGDGKISGHRCIKTEETALILKSDSPRPMYLKGFVGAVFNGSAWEAPDYDISYVEGELFYLLHKKDFMVYNQSAKLYHYINPEADDSTIEIEYVNADNKYLYMPYELKSFDSADIMEINGDYFKRIPSEKNSYSITAVPSLYQKLISLASDNKDKLTGVSYENYSVCENNYSEYVKKYYLEVAKQERNTIERFFDSNNLSLNSFEDNEYLKTIDEVREIINSYMSYDVDFKISLFKHNSIDYILSKNKGYDKHYATLATLMFRMAGVPSRYVEGYIISPNDAIKMKADTSVYVKGSQAHAWTEIYVEGTGWVPVEIYEEDCNIMFPDINQAIIGNSSK